ncbi:TPA: YesL family protein [Streptococcus suis]|nr:YesL family protein [Streptococcus suis]
MKGKGGRTLVQSLFDANHPAWQLVEKLFDLMLLNGLTVLASLPLFTLGIAKLALQASLWDMNEEGKIKVWSTYWGHFGRQWKQGLVLSLVEIGLTTFCLLDLYLIWGQAGLVFDSFRASCIAILLFSQLLWVYIYPLASRFQLRLKDLFFQGIFYLGTMLSLTFMVSLVLLLLVAVLFYSDLTLLIGLVSFLFFAYAGLSFLFIREFGSRLQSLKRN